MYPQYSPLHGGTTNIPGAVPLGTTTTAAPVATTGAYPTTGLAAPAAGYGVGHHLHHHNAYNDPYYHRRTRTALTLASALMFLVLLCYIVACVSPGWIYDSSDGNSAYAGLWHACIDPDGGSTHCSKVDSDASLRAARAFSIIQSFFALFTLIAIIMALKRLMYGHVAGGKLSKWGIAMPLALFTLICGIITFLVAMHALNFYDKGSITWDNLGWCWGLQVAGLALNLITIVLLCC